jgi:hypothetical protein
MRRRRVTASRGADPGWLSPSGAPEGIKFQAFVRSLSVMASGWVPRFTATVAMPSTLRSLSSGTFIGPGEGALPGAGCGKAVERAVWNVTAPSTFCMIW